MPKRKPKPKCEACGKTQNNGECLAYAIGTEYAMSYQERAELEFVINVLLETKLSIEDIRSIIKILIELPNGDSKRLSWLSKRMKWSLAAYDGPDSLKNAKNSHWSLGSEVSILHVQSNMPPKEEQFRNAIDEAMEQGKKK